MKKIVILGGGESGVGAALLAKNKGFDVFLSDKSVLFEKFRQELKQNAIAFEEGQHTFEKILQADEIIKSPGIAEKGELFDQIKAKKIPVIAEIEFASRFTDAKIIAITGSNGKTTTTLLVHHLFEQAGIHAGLAGNVGSSFAKATLEEKFDWFVLEVSSFQLDNCYDFRPHIAVLTNITPDHLDRYNYQFQNYIDAKFRIIQQQQKDDFFIYFTDNEPVPTEISKKTINSQQITVSLHDTQATAFVNENEIAVNFKEKKYVFALAEIPLKGQHNALNATCAILTCLCAGIDAEKIRAGFKGFKGAAHRLEEIAQIKGVTYINDSKATNTDAVFYALGSYNQPIIWIAGGIDKGNDYTQIEDLVKQKVKALICLGKDNSKLTGFFAGKVQEIRQTESMQEAVEIASALAQNQDIVLLSPACSSFDLFKNYEDRGNQFRESVLKLSDS
jgi:UDP-N-acetylmuramoylalanine--D-glutamate ligase